MNDYARTQFLSATEKNGMNWRYLLTGLVRHYTPEKLLFVLTNLRGNDNSAENNPDTHFASWHELFQKHGMDLGGKHILEIGSGRYARVALRLLAAGAKRVTLVDPYAVPLTVSRHQALLGRDLAQLNLDKDDAFARIQIIRGDFVLLHVSAFDKKADVVLSNAVLEHVQDPGLVLQRSWAWLGPGGISWHVIDLRDHSLGFKYPFEMLTYSRSDWVRFLDLPGGFGLNRWRVPDYVRAMKEAGFVNVTYEVLLQDKAGFEAIKPRLNSQFRALPDNIASTLGIYLYGEKPRQARESS